MLLEKIRDQTASGGLRREQTGQEGSRVRFENLILGLEKSVDTSSPIHRLEMTSQAIRIIREEAVNSGGAAQIHSSDGSDYN